MLTTVVFDVGGTLVDETTQWEAWADWLGVAPFTLFGAMGGLIACGVDHRDVVSLLLPGRTFEGERVARLAAGHRFPPPVLYDDAVPCLQALRADGWRLVVGGNQPVTYQQMLEALELPVDLVTSSGSLGAQKPSTAFFDRIASLAGVPVSGCVHVGDRADNDVVAAGGAGMTPVHVRRGPWGVLQPAPVGSRVVEDLAALPALLRSLRRA